MTIDVRAHNRQAWDKLVEQRNRWTVPVSADDIRRARQGDWNIVLTPMTPVPRDWFPDLEMTDVLCLASGGGQQGPVLAAAGAHVTVLDASPGQLARDRLVAERDGLALNTCEGDMARLDQLSNDSFDLIFHPCSNCFVPDIRPVWRECFRVLRPGGALLAGFSNPVRFIFDDERTENGSLEVRHSLPYSDLEDLDEVDLKNLILDKDQPLVFSHTLEEQIGGQLAAGFVMTGFYEDRYDNDEQDPISNYMATFMATRAVKPKAGGIKQ